MLSIICWNPILKEIYKRKLHKELIESVKKGDLQKVREIVCQIELMYLLDLLVIR